jgi:hypothetical protein
VTFSTDGGSVSVSLLLSSVEEDALGGGTGTPICSVGTNGAVGKT